MSYKINHAQIALPFLDAVVIFLTMTGVFLARIEFLPSWDLMPLPTTLLSINEFMSLALVSTLIIIVVLAYYGHYRSDFAARPPGIMRSMLDFSAGLGLALIWGVLIDEIFVSHFMLGMIWSVGAINLCLFRWLWQKTWFCLRNHYHYNQCSLVIVANDKEQASFLLKIASSETIWRCRYIISLGGKTFRLPNTKTLPWKTGHDRLDANINEIWLPQHASDQDNARVHDLACAHGIFVRVFDTKKNHPLTNNIPANSLLLPTPMCGWPAINKIIFEYLLAVLLAPLALILVMIMSLGIYCQDRGPIFYISQRVGRYGKLFPCYKLRTMVIGADKKKQKLQNERQGGVFFKIKNDPRVTKIGKLLRATSLDELPQLWNILKGDMTLIGPRPHLPAEVSKYNSLERRLLCLRPGISGLSQVSGLSNLSFKEEMKIELRYLQSWTWLTDLKIIYRSIIIMILRQNRG